jgi:hypothetical protein
VCAVWFKKSGNTCAKGTSVSILASARNGERREEDEQEDSLSAGQ